VKLRFTPTGRAQVLAAVSYIQEDDPAAARRFRRRAEAALRRLERFPRSGRPIPEFSELPYREVVVPPQRFFYKIVEKTVWVVAVWHGAQIPRAPSG